MQPASEAVRITSKDAKSRVPAWHAQAQATLQEIRSAGAVVHTTSLPANPERHDSLLSLRTMGFREEPALEALRLAEGDVAFAIELLLSSGDENNDGEKQGDEGAESKEGKEKEKEKGAEVGEQASSDSPLVPAISAAAESAAPNAEDQSAKPMEAEDCGVAQESKWQDAKEADGTDSEDGDWEFL